MVSISMVKVEEENIHCSRIMTGVGLRQSLPDDLIIEIFLKLPVRSLLLLKCTCKSWKTLISDSQFAKRHMQGLTMDPSITHPQMFYGTRGPIIVSAPVKPLLENPSESESTKAVKFSMEHKFRILGSCNGLLCLLDKDQGFVRLWNPSTNFKSKNSPSFNLLFDKWSVTIHGFGYDHVNDKYKVLVKVRLGHLISNVRLYTFGENSWTTIQKFPRRPTRLQGKFVSGTLNWVIVRRDGVYKQTKILSFDLAKETYSELLLPQEHDSCRVRSHEIGVLKNCLCLSFNTETHFVLWLMKEYGVVESWTKLMMIPQEHLRHNVYGPRFVIEVLFIFENSILLSTNHEIFLYNFNNGRVDHPLISCIVMLNPHLYIESLVSPQF